MTTKGAGSLAVIYGEWGATVACLQETMLERCNKRIWNRVGRGFLEGHLMVSAMGRSGGLLVAWNDHIDSKEDKWIGLCTVGIKLK